MGQHAPYFLLSNHTSRQLWMACLVVLQPRDPVDDHHVIVVHSAGIAAVVPVLNHTIDLRLEFVEGVVASKRVVVHLVQPLLPHRSEMNG